MTPGPFITAEHIDKQFAGVTALDDVSVAVNAGEVHALVGENGAGKSTLSRILSGALTPTSGEIRVNGTPVQFVSPRDAAASGIAMIPQELELITSLSVAENISLGREPIGTNGLVDRTQLHSAAHAALAAIEAHHIRTKAIIASLDPADRQLVAIARAIALDARCLIMDEPTASLGAAEAATLERVIRTLTARGTGIIYVSHKLDEVRRIANRITVLRDGALVATRLPNEVDEAELVRMMCGRAIPQSTLLPVADQAPIVLDVRDISVRDSTRRGQLRVAHVSFQVRRGEIVGLAGLVGAGRSDLLLALVGVNHRNASGSVAIDGKPLDGSSPASARDCGMLLLPEERKASGILPHQSVADNVIITALKAWSPLGWIRRGAERSAALRAMTNAGVRAPSPDVSITLLSGGNQQKALLARALLASPRVLLLDEPTRGIDLAARAELHGEIAALAASGVGVVLASSDMSEILTQCHRVLVFRRGRIVAELDRKEATEAGILAAAMGTAESLGPLDSSPGGTDGPRDSAPPPQGPRLKAQGRLSRYLGALGLLLVLALAAVTSPVRDGRLVFLDFGNLTDILRQVSEKGILAVGMTAVIISGGIDLSVGSVLAFAATMSAWLWMREGAGLIPASIAVVAAAAAWGLINGVVIARWKLPAFIATLATMSAARGAARYLSGGAAIPLGFGPGGAPASVRAIAAPIVPYLPAPALIFGVTALLVHLYLARTRAGRYVYAIGDNETAARLAGLRVSRHKIAVYVLCGALAGIAGLLHAAQLEQGNPNDGVAYELDAIAAAVIGGTTLSGGVGSVGGTIVGILIIGVINNAMGLNNVDANLQLILKGVIILVAVWLQRRRNAD